ncbi:MAG: hypothetical protein ACR2OR_06655, partial [Hyphomicrobiales bacterium]
MSEIGSETLRKPAQAQSIGPRAVSARKGAPVVAILLGLLLAAAAAMFAFRFQGDAPDWLLGAAAFVGAAGLCAVIGWIGGFVHFGRASREIVFFESTINAIEDAAVVTDMSGRVAFANGRYGELAADGSGKNVAGIENLYAGYPEISGQIYRLAQSAKGGKPARETLR